MSNGDDLMAQVERDNTTTINKIRLSSTGIACPAHVPLSEGAIRNIELSEMILKRQSQKSNGTEITLGKMKIKGLSEFGTTLMFRTIILLGIIYAILLMHGVAPKLGNGNDGIGNSSGLEPPLNSAETAGK